MPELVRDPICGTVIAPGTAVARRTLSGISYYFCTEGCVEQFDRQHGPAAAFRLAPGFVLWIGGLTAAALLVALVAVAVFRVSPAALLPAAAVLACPLLHLLMMRGLHHGHDHSHDDGHDRGAGHGNPSEIEEEGRR